MTNRQLFLFFLLGISLINLLQAGFTEMDPDEAYYWLYSRQPDWGYFDHPPVIGLMIRAGYSLFANELGARLLTVVLHSASLYILWHILGKPQGRRELTMLMLLMVAFPVLQVYGFIATPDSPLLFFTALYFLLYKNFIEKDSWKNTLLLGACMALLLYSKYHGVLVIFFLLLSNWKLLLNPKFYVASVFGFLLFFPHLWWQYTHDFPSFRYHLSGRDDPYEIKHTTNYLLNQFAVFGPMLIVLLPVLFRTKAAGTFERGLRFLIWGFWIFFLYTTSKGHVEPQWTAILALTFVLICFWESQRSDIFRKWAVRTAWFTVGLLVLARIFLVWNFLGIESYFHKKEWVEELQTEADGRPVVFQSSYRDPAKYSFYTKERSYSFTDVYYRPNQFDIWDWETDIHNKDVFLVRSTDKDKCAGCYLFEMTNKRRMVQRVDSLQISQDLVLSWEKDAYSWPVEVEQELAFSVYNPYDFQVKPEVGNMPLGYYLAFFQEGAFVGQARVETSLSAINPDETRRQTGRFKLVEGLPVGKYSAFLCVKTGSLPPAINSAGLEVIITE